MSKEPIECACGCGESFIPKRPFQRYVDKSHRPQERSSAPAVAPQVETGTATATEEPPARKQRATRSRKAKPAKESPILQQQPLDDPVPKLAPTPTAFRPSPFLSVEPDRGEEKESDIDYPTGKLRRYFAMAMPDAPFHSQDFGRCTFPQNRQKPQDDGRGIMVLGPPSPGSIAEMDDRQLDFTLQRISKVYVRWVSVTRKYGLLVDSRFESIRPTDVPVGCYLVLARSDDLTADQISRPEELPTLVPRDDRNFHSRLRPAS